jgi:hypothetical protein
MAQQVPSVGRIVHFMHGDIHVPAIMVEPGYALIEPGPSEIPVQDVLVVFTRTEHPFMAFAVRDDACTPGSWHWPEFIPAIK